MNWTSRYFLWDNLNIFYLFISRNSRTLCNVC